MHDKQVRRRRAVLALLVGVSLILLTAYFGESPSSPLHSVQRRIVQVLSPVQEGASKVLSPVRDVAGWFSDTLNAKSRASRLQVRVNQLQKEVDSLQLAQIQNQQLRADVKLDDAIGISAYRPVTGSVISRDPILWYQTIEVDQGSGQGVGMNDPVVGDGALVGDVTTVGPGYCVVTLITDHTFAAAALVEDANGDTGVLEPDIGSPNQLLLQDLPNQAPIAQGQAVVTAGFKSGQLSSLYPAGLPIGTVSNANQDQLYNNQQVHVTPTADLRRLSVVQILTRPHPGLAAASAGTARAQVPPG